MGLGETITYPDGQFQETCNVPNYRTSVDCAAGTNCSTDVGADDTSKLKVTEASDERRHLDRNGRLRHGAQLQRPQRELWQLPGL